MIPRNIEKQFNKIEDAYKIIALVGPRQAGKTTFLKENIKPKNGTYLSFDDPDARTLFSQDIKKFEIQFMNEKNVIVLDEVNYALNSGINLKYLADKGHKMWISASSELLLGKEVLSYLVGRVSILRLFPFSFDEFKLAKKQKEFNDEILERLLWEHITFGGYPKVILTENIELKKTILQDLYETMILKDISKNFNIEDINSLEKFVKYLALKNGTVLSYSEACKELSVSFQTLKKYMSAMKKSYLIYETIPFYSNKLKEITKQPKVYFIDCGMRNAISNQFDIHLSGELFENQVVSELLKAGFSPKYWRTKSGAEVDIVLEKNSQIIPIEVKLKSDGKVGSGLKTFIEEHSPSKSYIVSYSKEAEKKEISLNGCKINFLNLPDLMKILVES